VILEDVTVDRFPQRLAPLRDRRQLGNNSVREGFIAQMVRNLELPLHPEPLDRGSFVKG
jgi:hypothetical protein